MGAGKTERPTTQDSLFTKGRRINKTNDNVLRGLNVKGGRLRKVRDKWTIEVPKSSGGNGGGSIVDPLGDFEKREDVILDLEVTIDTPSEPELNGCVEKKITATRGTILVEKGTAAKDDDELVKLLECKPWNDLEVIERTSGLIKQLFLVPARTVGVTTTANTHAKGVRCWRVAAESEIMTN